MGVGWGGGDFIELMLGSIDLTALTGQSESNRLDGMRTQLGSTPLYAECKTSIRCICTPLNTLQWTKHKYTNSNKKCKYRWAPIYYAVCTDMCTPLNTLQEGTMVVPCKRAQWVQSWCNVGKVQHSVVQKGATVQLIATLQSFEFNCAFLVLLQHHVQNIDNVVHCISICTGIVVQCISFACIVISSTVYLYLLVSLVIECCRIQCCEKCIWICL